jgi:two-component system OmpR family response regulator
VRILVVEDEEAMAAGLKFNFEQEGWQVVHAGDGPTALDYLKNADKPPVDLVILDLMLPSMSGYETCRRIRTFNNDIPILVLSARSLSEDRTMAFDCGTNQYLTKPFALPELLSRVRNLTSRSRAAASNGPPEKPTVARVFEFGSVHVDFDKFEIRVKDKTINPTTIELELLRLFIQNEGRVLSRGEILEKVWGYDSDASTRTIDNFVLRLRKIIEENPSEPKHILSVRGTGYRFIAEPGDASPPDDNSEGSTKPE